MTTRERFHAVMNFQPFDRLPILEWAGWWNKTIERWHGEGLPAEMVDRYEIARYLGLDVYLQDWIRAMGPDCPRELGHGAGIVATEEDYERVRPLLFPRPAVNRELWER